MKQKIFIFVILSIFTFQSNETSSNEPFVILDYHGTNVGDGKLNKNNIFVKNQGYSVKHKIKNGESLSDILKKYYGNSGLNMRIIEVSIIEINKHAFVRKNPNYMFAGKTLIIPSINHIMNLVKNSKNNNFTNSSRREHIYFFSP